MLNRETLEHLGGRIRGRVPRGPNLNNNKTILSGDSWKFPISPCGKAYLCRAAREPNLEDRLWKVIYSEGGPPA